MSHLLYTGTFVELQDLFIEQVAAARKQDPLAPLTVLVPGQLVRASLSRELTKSGCPHANIRFVTVHETAQRLAEPVLRAKGQHAIKDVTRDLLIQKTIDDRRSMLTYFARIVDFSGFRTKLLSTLADLAGACVTIPMLIEAANSELRDYRPAVSLKLKEIALLWSTYESLLEKYGFVERHTVIEAAMESLNSNESDPQPLILYGLDEISELEMRFLERLWNGRETAVYHPWQDSPAYIFTQDLMSRYLEWGFENRTEVKQRAKSGSLLSKIQRGVFREITPTEPEPDYQDTSISITSSPDAHRETQETIRSVVYSVVSEKTTSAILMRTAQPYTNYLRSAVREAGVQPYFHECRTLGESLSGIALLRFVKLLKGDYKRVDVADFLLCGKLKKPSALEADMLDIPAAEWNQFCLLSGITSGKENWRINLSRFRTRIQWKSEHSAVEDEASEQDFSRQLASLDTLLNWLEILFACIEDIRSCSTFMDFAEKLRDAFEDFVECDETTEEIFEQLDQAIQLDQSLLRLTSQGMISCIETALRSPSKREGRYQETEPTIATIQQTRGVVFDNVHLIGLNEGEFPRFSSQDPILLDSERELLSQALSQGSFAVTVPQLSNRMNQEMYYFASVMDSARCHASMSFSRTGSRGRETLPSRYVLASLSAIFGQSVDVKLLNHFIEQHSESRYISRQSHSSDETAISRREYNAALIDEALMTEHADGLAYLQTLPLFKRVLSGEYARYHTKEFTNFEGTISASITDSDVKKYFLRIISLLSASQLEKYWSCPFHWFASRVLALENIEEPDILCENDPLVRGSLIHRILEKFYRAEKRAGRIESLASENWDRLRDFAVTELSEFESQQPVGLLMLWNREKSRIMELLKRFYLDDIENWNGFIPHRFEWQFGKEDHQLKLQVTKEKALYFHGAIDRIDEHNNGHARILDYKSGRNSRGLKADTLLRQRALQLHIYTLAVESLLNKKVESASYYYMREDSHRRIELTERAFSESIDEFRDTLRVLDDQMRKGACQPYPDKELCRFCEMKTACGQGRLTRKWRNSGESHHDFLSIREGEV